MAVNELSIAAEDQEYFGATLMETFWSNLALFDIVRNDFDDVPMPPFKNLNIPVVDVIGDARDRDGVDDAVIADEMGADYIPVFMSEIYKSVRLSNAQQTFSRISFMEKAAQDIGKILARKADAKILELALQTPYIIGTTDGTAVFTDNVNSAGVKNYNILSRAITHFEQFHQPTDNLYAVVGSAEAGNIRELDIFNKANEAGDKEQQVNGRVTRKMAHTIRMSQAIAEEAVYSTAAQWGTPLVNSAAGYMVGDESMAVDGLGVSTTLKKGSVFKLEGYYYTLKADAATTGGGGATISFYPKLLTAPDDNAALEPITYSDACSVNLSLDPTAILAVSRPLMPLAALPIQWVAGDPESGVQMNIRLESKNVGSAGEAASDWLSAHCLVGRSLLRHKGIVRITGQKRS